MARVIRFPIPIDPAGNPGAVFDPETTALIVAAYDRVCREMHDKGQPAVVREVIARHLIAIASKGERDPDRLWRGTLTSLGLPERPT